jgi:hypothetical protein
MEPRKDNLDLITELRSLRPSPRPEFVAELDRRVEAGFPSRDSGPRTLIGRATARLRSTPPRRLLAPVGAFAALALVIATAIVTTSHSGTGPSLSFRSENPDEVVSPSNSAESAAGTAARESRHANGTASAGDAGGIQHSEVAPQATDGTGSSGSAFQALEPLSSNANGAGRYASHAGRRDVERSAQIVLGADPADVRGDAAKVFDAVHAADGIVLRSSIRDGAAGEAGAHFDLLIPSGKIGDALAAFSAIAEVRSRHESTQDITAPTIGVGERLQDSQARIEGLLAQLATTAADAERTAVETELRTERARAAALRSHLAALRRRANLSRVSLRIETGKPSGAGGAGSAWGTGDGLHDAGRILAIAAGVAIVGLAIIAPLALICLLAWLAHRAWLRRARHRALA